MHKQDPRLNSFAHISQPYSINLTQPQQAFINTLMPQGYSLQLAHSNQATPLTTNAGLLKIKGRKNVSQSQISIQNDLQSGQTNKRRKVKIHEQIDNQQVQQQKPKSGYKHFSYQPSPPSKQALNSHSRASFSHLGSKQSMHKHAVIIKKLKKHDSSWPFRQPVDPKALLIPNYVQVVKIPMDLQTIQNRIREQQYQHSGQIQRDVFIMLMNSYKFNKSGQYYQQTFKLQQYYLSLLQQLEQPHKKQPTKQKHQQQPHNSINSNNSNNNSSNNQIPQLQKDLMGLLKKAAQLINNNQASTHANINGHGHGRKRKDRAMHVSIKNQGTVTLKDRRELMHQIKMLGQLHFGRIWHIVKGFQTYKQEDSQEILQLDLQKIDNKTIRQLQNYVRLQKNSIIHQKQESGFDSQQNQYSFQ